MKFNKEIKCPTCNSSEHLVTITKMWHFDEKGNEVYPFECEKCNMIFYPDENDKIPKSEKQIRKEVINEICELIEKEKGKLIKEAKDKNPYLFTQAILLCNRLLSSIRGDKK